MAHCDHLFAFSSKTMKRPELVGLLEILELPNELLRLLFSKVDLNTVGDHSRNFSWGIFWGTPVALLNSFGNFHALSSPSGGT